MEDKYYTVSELAKLLKVDNRTILKLINTKKLKAINLGTGERSHWRIFEGQYLNFIAEFYK